MNRANPNTALILAICLAVLTGFHLVAAPALAQSDGGQTITLADAGRARFQIVAAPDGIEAYAAKTLAGYLKEMTGAEFPVVSPVLDYHSSLG